MQENPLPDRRENWDKVGLLNAGNRQVRNYRIGVLFERQPPLRRVLCAPLVAVQSRIFLRALLERQRLGLLGAFGLRLLPAFGPSSSRNSSGSIPSRSLLRCSFAFSRASARLTSPKLETKGPKPHVVPSTV